MKAISFVRPGAHSITDFTCRLINRHYEPGDLVNQYIAIHSSKNYSKEIEKSLRVKGFNCPDEHTSETGILGIAQIGDPVNESNSSWFDGPVGWPLTNVRVFRKPIQISGSLGVWDIPLHVVDMIKGRWNQSVPGFWETTERQDEIGAPLPQFSETPVLAINAQTTGVKRGDQIVSLALIELYNSQITEELVTVVNPRCTIPESTIPIHGITKRMARNERGIYSHKNTINRLLNRARYIVGHDAYFTIKYLAKSIKTDLWNRHAIIIDTKKMLGKPLRKLEKKKQSNFVAKNNALVAYKVAFEHTKDRPIKHQVQLGTLIDQALIWKGEKKK